MHRFNDGWRQPRIKHGRPTRWGWIVLHPSGLALGRCTDIGAGCLLQCGHGVTIDDFAQLGGGVKVYSEDTISDYNGCVVIGEGACIGANSVILPGVRIGEGAIVGALSLVLRDTVIPKNEIWAGCPAVKIGKIEGGQRIYERPTK